ncbi:hypothetical protein [Roseobacter sp. TSBP12]|uniref:hypothetical protein n=1 Tax=Roseobacter sp. TSBP12 TaxID=1236613 RepID=UPI00125F3200|nr:hypothetical protein [Roseobacter sp. TSBP12]KAB6717712.1 hypothetical protein C8029_04120 [Roseobacter sp. TSBP12]
MKISSMALFAQFMKQPLFAPQDDLGGGDVPAPAANDAPPPAGSDTPAPAANDAPPPAGNDTPSTPGGRAQSSAMINAARLKLWA